MGWIDDLTSRVTQIKEADAKIKSAVGDDVYTMLSSRATEAFVKVLPSGLTGNLTAQQIQQGQTGSGGSITPSEQPAGILANAGASLQQGFSKYGIYIAVGLGALLLMSKKARK